MSWCPPGPFGQLAASATTYSTAVEVELTLKAADRLRDIVRDLTLDHEAVLYVVADATIGRAVEASVKAVGGSDRVHVVDLARLVIRDA